MLRRSELEFQSRACLTLLKLRVVVFSMAIGLPAWLGASIVQKLGFQLPATGRIGWLVLLLIYILGVVVIIRRTQATFGLVCPHCKRLLGVELTKLTKSGDCARCGGNIVKS